MKENTPSTKIKVLEEIISLDGNCLLAKRCTNCPLRMKCHPTFYSDSTGKSRFRNYERVNAASDILTNIILMGDEEYASENNMAEEENPQ